MSNYNSLKTTIDANIKQNGRQEITGQILNSVLNQMVTTLGAGYQFAGVATTATNPGSPDAKVFYIANGKGTYTNFGGLEVTEDDVVVLYYDTEWHKVATGIASQEKLTELEGEIKSDVVATIATNATYAQRNINVSIAKGELFRIAINTSCKITKIPSWVQLEQGLIFGVGSYYFVADEDITQMRFTDNTTDLSVVISTGLSVVSDNSQGKIEKAYYDSQIGLSIKTLSNDLIVAKGLDSSGYLVSSTNRIGTNEIVSGNSVVASVQVGKYNVIWYKNGYKIGETGWKRNTTSEIIVNEDANGFRIILSKVDDTNLDISYLTTMMFSCLYAYNGKYNVKNGTLSENANVPCVIKANHAFRITIDIYSAISKICEDDWISLTNNSKVAPNSYIFSTDRDIDYIRFVDFGGTLHYAIEYGEEIDTLFATRKTMELDGKGTKEDKFRYILPYDASHMTMGRYLSSRNLREQITSPLVDEKLGANDVLINTAGKLVSNGTNIFILKAQNDITGASIESKYQYLVKFDTTNNTTTKIKVFDTSVPLTIGGTSYNVADFIEGCIAFINGKVVVTSWAYITTDTTKSCLITKVVNPNTLSIESTQICKLTADGSTNDFINSFLATTIIGQDRQYCTIFNSGISLYDGYYYGVVKFTNLVILKSADLINWTLEKVLDGDGMFGEVGIDINSQGIAHLAYRFAYNNLIYQYKIVKYSVSDWKEMDYAYVKGDCSMATFFRYDGKLYLFSSGDDAFMNLVSNSEGRRTYNISYIDEKYLEHSRILMDTNGVLLGANTNVVEVGGYLYSCLIGTNLKIVKFIPKVYTIEEVNSVMDNILNS